MSWVAGIGAGVVACAGVVAMAWPITDVMPQVPTPPSVEAKIAHQDVGRVVPEPPPPPAAKVKTKPSHVAVDVDTTAPPSPAADPPASPPPEPPAVDEAPRGPRAQARLHVQRLEAKAEAPAARQTLITDAYGRPMGNTEYLAEAKTDLPLRLSAIVDPTGGDAFAVIEDEKTGTVATYGEGKMLWPGVLPGVWVVDIQPGVVHLLDLRENKFEYLTYTKAKPNRPARRPTKRRPTRRRR